MLAFVHLQVSSCIPNPRDPAVTLDEGAETTLRGLMGLPNPQLYSSTN